VAEEHFKGSLKQRAIQSLKFSLIVKKSVVLMQKKRDVGLQIRAFGGLKWFTEIKDMQKDYQNIVKHREMSEAFYSWFEAAHTNRRKRQLLEAILDRKHYYDQIEAFGIWKKDSFFKTMVNLINQLIIQPSNEDLVSNVFHSWRQAKEFEHVREEYEQLADANYQFVLTKQMFSEWKEAASERMPLYLALKRGINKITNVMVSDSYFQLIAINEKEKAKEDKVFYLLKRKKYDFSIKVIRAWKNAIIETKVENQKIDFINNHFKAISSRESTIEEDQNSELTFEIFKNTQKHPTFKLPSKILIQIN
jgi:hypothetical protein